MTFTRTNIAASFDLQTAKAWLASYFFWFFGYFGKSAGGY